MTRARPRHFPDYLPWVDLYLPESICLPNLKFILPLSPKTRSGIAVTVWNWFNAFFWNMQISLICVPTQYFSMIHFFRFFLTLELHLATFLLFMHPKRRNRLNFAMLLKILGTTVTCGLAKFPLPPISRRMAKSRAQDIPKRRRK